MNPRPPGPQPDALPTELHSPPIEFRRRATLSLFESGSTLGAPEGIRTPDPRLRRPLLFPLSYWRESGRADLNGRPPAPKAGALPGCATPRTISNNTRSLTSQPCSSEHGCATTQISDFNRLRCGNERAVHERKRYPGCARRSRAAAAYKKIRIVRCRPGFLE